MTTCAEADLKILLATVYRDMSNILHQLRHIAMYKHNTSNVPNIFKIYSKIEKQRNDLAKWYTKYLFPDESLENWLGILNKEDMK